NISQSKIDSNYDSVQEQTGFYAGQGGYQIDVGNHTQLDGSVIASTADADKNRLNTGTFGWSDIRNKAEYSSEQQSVGASSGGSMGSQIAGDLANTVPVGSKRAEAAISTAHSAVSEGELIIRNGEAQQQDVATLNRDVDNANNALSLIFDKEKEQQR